MRGLSEPLINVAVSGDNLPFLVDSGARYSTVKDPKYRAHASPESVAVVGFSGQTEYLPLTHPLPSVLAGQRFSHPYLLSPQCPANLLGRDILIKTNASILCSPDGLRVSFPDGTSFNCSAPIGASSQMLLARPTRPDPFQQTIIYWGLLERPLVNSELKQSLYTKFSMWKPWLQAMAPYGPTRDPPHITFSYSRSPFDESFAYEWDHKKYDSNDSADTGRIFLSSLGVAAEVFLTDEQMYWYKMGPESVPHITLLLGPKAEARSLGPFVKRAQQARDWQPTQIPNVQFSPSLQAHSIAHSSEESILYDETPVVRDHHRDKQDHDETEAMYARVPPALWSQDPYDVGHCTNTAPVTFEYTPDPPVYRPQYPMSPAAKEGIDQTVLGLKRSGVLEPSTDRQWNTPILPVKKAGGKSFRMAHDLRSINSRVTTPCIPVPNPHVAVAQIGPGHRWFTVIDLANAFFCIPLAQRLRHIFSFVHNGERLQYTRLPQGFNLSPGIFNKVLREQLTDLDLPPDTILIQYVDDLLLASPDAVSCMKATETVLNRLAEKGFKVSKNKVQCTRREVAFLGRLLTEDGTGMSTTHQDSILSHPKPSTVKDMLSFLGLCGYSSMYLPEYKSRTAPLRALVNDLGARNLTARLKWDEFSEKAFISLKQDMSTVCALSSADYQYPFFLDISEKQNTVNGVLFQKKGGAGGRTILLYASISLDQAEAKEPPCVRHAAGTAGIIKKIGHIVMRYPLTVLTSHSIVSFVNSAAFTMTSTRQTRLEKVLTQEHITYTHDGINMADYLPGEGEPHMCEEKIVQDIKIRPDMQDSPVPGAEDLFTDGCCYRHPHEGLKGAYAVVRHDTNTGLYETVESERVTGKVSAQLAELKGVTAALSKSTGKIVNIYTDSAYVYNVVHYDLKRWLRAGFITSTGVPVKHYQEVKELEAAIMKPRKVAVIKCKGHSKTPGHLTNGNNAADRAAKQTAGYEVAYAQMIQTPQPEGILEARTDDALKREQDKASPQERTAWHHKGARKGAGDIWYSPDGRPVIPPGWVRAMMKEAHTPGHVGRTQMMRSLTHWWHPYLPDLIANHLEECSICGCYNIRATIKPHQGKFPAATMAGEEVVIDYTDMLNRHRGKRYLLVVVDAYTGWPEAIACAKEDADTVVKFLVQTYIPRHGFPKKIRSDNGSHFKNHDLATVEASLGLRHKFGAVYHPQSQGKVERMNQNIKQKLAKVCAETGLNWVDGLPLALMVIRSSICRTTGFTPYEMTHGHQFPGPSAGATVSPELYERVGHKGYYEQLKHLVAEFADESTEARARGHTEEAEGSREAEYVRLKVVKPKWCSPRFTGPHKVTRRTNHAVQLEGKGTTWYHWSHCVAAATPTRSLEDTVQDLGDLHLHSGSSTPAQETSAGEEAPQGTAPPE